MFFTAANFDELRLDAEVAKQVAKKANDLIKSNGSVVFGTKYSDGKVENFSTGNNELDMHVGIIVGIREMGIFEPNEKLVHSDPLNDDDIARAKDTRLAMQEKENQRLREINKRLSGPTPPGNL